MTYDIYFHDDYDGRASAAVVLAFLRSRGDGVKRFVPVDYSIEPKWPTMKFARPTVIVDFLYHPKAAMWFDHHETTFLKPEWKKKFRKTKFRHLDPKYFSACHLVLDHFVKHFGFKPSKNLRELAKWLDVTDGARYASARQAVEKKEPALLVEEFIERHRKGGASLEWLIKLLAVRSLRQVAQHSEMQKAKKRLLVQNTETIRWYREHVELHGHAGFTDLTAKDIVESRFMPYYVHPKLLYSIRLKHNRDGSYHVSVGANPWKRGVNKIHVGRFLRARWGGGGHHDVGGAETRSRARAMQMVKESIEKFS